MYAIIRTGGKQAKVEEGDVIDVERLNAEGEVTFTPLLVVNDKGKVYSGREKLKTAKVKAKVVPGTRSISSSTRRRPDTVVAAVTARSTRGSR